MAGRRGRGGRRRRRRRRRYISCLQSLLSCQVSVPVREHWFPVTRSACMRFNIGLLKGALRIMGLLWRLWPHQEAHPHIDLFWRHAWSPLLKPFHDREGECWLHTLICYGNCRCERDAAESSQAVTWRVDTETANSANVSGCGDLTFFPFLKRILCILKSWLEIIFWH